MRRHSNDEHAFVIASMIITTTFIVLISSIILQLVVASYQLAQANVYRANAQFAADAGIDASIVEINIDNTWTGTSGEVEILNNGSLRTTYSATVTDVDTSNKIIDVVGRTYFPVSDTEPQSERKYSIDLEGLGSSSGSFAIVTGVGGLILRNSAKIVDGDVFVNGTITMSNSSQIGTTLNSVSVKAAHESCPTTGGPTYPTACTSGEPISIGNSAKIYGQVCANNQTSAGGIDTSGTNGLYQVGVDTAECGTDDPILALPLPDHDRATQESDASAGTSTAYYTNCNSNSASRVWPHGLHITGDVVVKKKCKITVEGDVWIDGSLTISNAAQLIVDDTPDSNIVDSTYPSIMVDGSGGISLKNSAKVVSNSSSIGLQFVSYWADATCNPGCTSVVGDELFDSADVTTISLTNSSEAPNSILFARWSQVDLNNGGDIGALVGQKVQLRNSAAVTFGASLSGGGGGSSSQTWLLENYRRDF